jgi:transcriptional regulator with XRE-family HTH domain
VERGVVNPSLDSLLKIANALTIEVAELFLNEGLVVLTYDDVVRAESSLAVLRNVLGTAKSKFS